MNSDRRLPTVVLVHGAWHGAWTWDRLTPLLRHKGMDVRTPTLTGLGDRAHLASPSTSISLHVEDVVRHVETEHLESVVLVGHSYAGLVVAAAATRLAQRVAGVVFLDSFVPDGRLPLFDLISAGERDHLRSVAAANDPSWMLPPFPPSGYGVTDPDMAAWLSKRLDPMPIACFEEPVEHDERVLASVPQAYVFATCSDRDRFSGFAARFRDHGRHGYHEVPSGHDMMLTHPSETANALEAGVRSFANLQN